MSTTLSSPARWCESAAMPRTQRAFAALLQSAAFVLRYGLVIHGRRGPRAPSSNQ